MRLSLLLVPLFVLPLGLVLSVTPAAAWSGTTHICTANYVRLDVADDGAIEVYEVVKQPDGDVTRNLLGTIPLPEDLAAAIRDWPQEFRAGSCSADAYPDMYIGQSVIHPYVPWQPWRASDWARHVLKCAREQDEGEERGKALAFAAGWLVHYAGDAFGHTHVNQYAGGAWDWGNMDIVLKHVAYESYINSKLPHDPAELHDFSLDCDATFVKDALMLHEEVRSSLENVGYMEALLDYYDAFDNAVEDIEHFQSKKWARLTGAAWALNPIRDVCRQQRDAADRALMEWGETSTRVIRDMTENNPVAAIGAVNEWVTANLAHLMGIPEGAEELVDWLGAPMGLITDPLSRAMDRLVNYIWEHVMRGTFQDIVNPEDFMLAQHGEAVRAEVDELMGVTGGHPDLDPLAFQPFHDTVVLAKLALLDEAGIQALGTLLGVTIPTQGAGDSLLWDCLESLDASNQLYLHPKFRLLETPELEQQAFRRLFLAEPYRQGQSAIDPAHFLLYPLGGKLNFSVGTPVEDPLNDRCQMRGYVYQTGEGEGGDARVPVCAVAAPTYGVAGGWTEPLPGEWQAGEAGTYVFHLALATTAEGSADLEEDAGIDVRVTMTEEEAPPGPDPGELPDQEQMLDFMQQMLDAYRQVLAEGGTQMSAEQRAAMEQRIAEVQAALDQARAGETPGTGGAPPPADAYVYPPDVLDAMTAIAGGEEFAQRPALGTVEDENGEPVAGATVTMLAKPLFDELRAATGVPLVDLDACFMTTYLMGRTNAEGQYFLPLGPAEGEWVIIASAPRLPKVEQAVTVAAGAAGLQTLPPVRLVAEEEEGEEAGGGGLGGGQHPANPDFTLALRPQVISYDAAEEDGTVQAQLTVRPLGGFRGPVQLEALGLPQGVTAEFTPNPVELDEPQLATVVFRSSPAARGTTMARITGEGGGLTRELTVVVALAGGKLSTKPGQLALRPGQTVTAQVVWDTPDHAGSGVFLALGELPEGLSVRAKRLRGNTLVPALELENLTPEKVEAADEKLRPRLRAPRLENPNLPELTQEDLDKAPEELPFAGVLIAPGGWLELAITAAKDMEPGTYRIPVNCERGRHRFSEELVIRVR